MNDEVKTTPGELNYNSPGLQPGVKVHFKKPVQLQINLSGKQFLNRNARTFIKIGIPVPTVNVGTPPLIKGERVTK